MRLFRRGRAGIFSRGGKLTARRIYVNNDDYSRRRDYFEGVTALMYACEEGDIECARLLVEKGADVNARDTCAASCVFW